MGEKKTCQCIVCGADVEVTKFATPSKVRCDAHKDVRVATAHMANSLENHEPIQLEEVEADLMSEMAEEVRNWGGDLAFCPQDADHTVTIKSVVRGPHGVVVTHQCRDCLTIISYSTQHHRELLCQGIRELARDTAGVTWLESRLGIYPGSDVRGIITGEDSD